MFWFIVGIVLLLAAIIAVVTGIGLGKQYKAAHAEYEADLEAWRKDRGGYMRDQPRKPRKPNAGVFSIAATVAVLLAVGSFFGAATYKQDEGHASVMRSFTGKVIGEPDTTSGLSMKAPWVKAIKFDTRDNQLKYEGLSFSDKNGTSGSIDLDLTYNLIPAKTDAVYREYKTQKGFEERRVSVDVPAALRAVTPQFTNVEMKTRPSEASAAVMAELATKWVSWGVQGVQIRLGSPSYSDKINERLEYLTAEQTRAKEAKAATDAAEEKAKRGLVEAKAEAESNNLLEKSLTGNVLKNRQIEVERQRVEAIKTASEHGNMIITDGGAAQPQLFVDAGKASDK